MRTERALHLADFIKIVEQLPKNQEENFRIRIRNPDEEVRLSRWFVRELEAERGQSGGQVGSS